MMPLFSGIKFGITMAESYNPQAVVRFRGRSYILFKRSEKEGCPYSFRIQTGGTRRIVSTGTADVTLARVKAKEQLTEILDGKYEETIDAKKAKSQVPTVGEVIDSFLGGDQHVREHTGRAYTVNLLKVLKDTRGWDKETARKQKIDVLTDALVRDYQALRQGRQTVSFVEPLDVNTGINSMIRQARAVFSRRAILNYEKAGMVMPPTLSGFLRAPGLKEVSHRYSDHPIPQKQIDQLNQALPQLKEMDERLWAVHLMIRLMGLRDSEISRAKKHWLVERDGRTFLVINRREGEDAPKRSDGEVPVPPVLLEWFGKQEGDDLIPTKNKSERYDLIYRQHSKWVRQFVTGRTKTNHELRKWAGSMVATKTNSWERAAEFLRIDLETAKLHYLAFTTPAEPLSLEDLG